MSVSPFRIELRSTLGRKAVHDAKEAATAGLPSAHLFLADPDHRAVVESALRIRAVEQALYDLFGKGKLHGTIHTCLGQEFSGAVLGPHLTSADLVTSNHRCHGHFIAATGNWKGLIDEIVGNRDGVCGGVGSSQHLYAPNFLSNGQQGGLLPVAAGLALSRKETQSGVVVSFIGEGTLGEGIVYETLNIDVLWDLPHIIICENNFYSQSTAQDTGLAGSIKARAAAFSMATASVDCWDLPSFDSALTQAMERARDRSQPTFLVLTTYRLNPHSKGDDLRDKSEIEWFRARDPVSLAIRDYRHFASAYEAMTAEIDDYVAVALDKPPLEAKHYFASQLPVPPEAPSWRAVATPADASPRLAQQLNGFYLDWLNRDDGAFFLGEDIADPYGGAFKVSRGFTSAFPGRARTTPISEAAITGVGIGLAIAGHRAFVEIMFGDFITYAFDQIINNASKVFHMYNQAVDCPVIVRTPMGGRRGYGPTHSQSLERFLIGIDNVCTVSLNSLLPVDEQLAGLAQLRCPTVLIENKSDYANRTFKAPDGYCAERDGGCLPTVRVRPVDANPTLTILAYGGMARFVADCLLEIFERTDVVSEMIVPGSLTPFDAEPLVQSLRQTHCLLIIEEGAGFGSFGAEVAAQLHERTDLSLRLRRLSGRAVPVPSAPSLEAAALPSIDDVCAAIESLKGPE